MNKNEPNMKNKKLTEPTKKDVKNSEELLEMPVEGACSPEFSEGCIAIDDEIDE